MRYLKGLFAVLLITSAVFATHTVNNRVIPNKADYASSGESVVFIRYDTLFTELSGILGSVVNSDAIDVNKATADTVVSSYITDAAGTILPLRASSMTFGILAVAAEVDSAYATAANTTEQVISFNTATFLPALARVVDMVIVCVDSVTHSDSATVTTMAFDIGTSSGGTQYLEGAPDETDDIASFAADSLGHVIPAIGETAIYIGATPGQNWSTLIRGKWKMYVIYYDLTDI